MNEKIITPKPKRRLVGNLFLFFATTLFSLLLAEAIARIYLSTKHNDLESLKKYHEQQKKPKPDQQLMLGDMLELWNNDYRIFRMRPGIEGQFYNCHLKINEKGYRGVPLSEEKSPDTFRLVGIGDSVMFGWGLDDRQTYMQFLNDFLTTSTMPQTHLKFDFANLSVPGYNSIMELETLKEDGLPIKPNVIVIGFCDNDWIIPCFIKHREKFYALNRSYLWALLRPFFLSESGKKTEEARVTQAPAGQLVAPPGLLVGADFINFKTRSDGYKFEVFAVPEEFKYLAGWDKVEYTFKEIARLGKKHNFTPIVVTHYYLLNDYVKGKTKVADREVMTGIAYAKKEGILVADSLDLLVEFLKTTGKEAKDTLWLGPNDAHPSPACNMLLAAALYRTMVENDILPDAAQRKDKLNEHINLLKSLALEKLKEKY